MKLLGLDDLSAAGAARYKTAMMVVWALIMFVSLVPLALIEFTMLDYALRVASRSTLAGTMSAEDREKFTEHEEDIEHVRVSQAGWSGLSIALLAGFLLVTCQVANEKNVRRDVSYFKTSAPGESTVKIAKASKESFKVLLFFPEINAVKDEVRGYFESLAADTGKVTIEEHDFMSAPRLATRYGVSKHGVILITKGDLFLDDEDPKKKAPNERIDFVETDIEKVRRGKNNKLKNLDRDVNTALLKLAREKRKAYLTVGHGEINDWDSVPSDLRGAVLERRTTFLKKRLGELNYEVKELGLVDLIQGVPEDAAIVGVFAPSQPLTPEELAALDRYVDKGGRIMIALDPRGNGSVLGPLEGRLGVKFNRAAITDDKFMYRQLGTPADRRWAVTTQFSAHSSTTTLSRSVDKGLLVVDSGALEDVPFTANADKTKRTYVIRSMTNSWLDLDDDFMFDDGAEKRDRYNIAAAIEGPKVAGADGAETDGFRAMVFADADLFADLTAVNLGNYAILTVNPVPPGYMSQPMGLTSGPLLEDAVKWLGGEENIVGDVVSEDDVPIKHTQDKDTAWFLAMIAGAPLLVLGFGGWFITRRKRKAQRLGKAGPGTPGSDKPGPDKPDSSDKPEQKSDEPAAPAEVTS
jgi:LPXTG-motif cell wall-anchored protein